MPTDLDECKCGWVKLYHPRGPLVTIPVTTEKIDYAALLENVSGMLDAGFLATAPGLEEGEQKFDAAAVVRRSKLNQDNTESAVIDLYEDGNEWKSLSVYLDSAAEVEAFEFASKLRLDDIPILPAQAAPQRGANKQTDGFFRQPGKPFGVVCKANPKHDPNEQDAKKKKPKRLFVRWVDEKPQAAPSGHPAAQPVAVSDEALLERWKEYSVSDPPLDLFNAWVRSNIQDVPPHLKKSVWEIVKAHAAAAGWVWNDQAKAYQVPKQQPAAAGRR